MAIPAVAIAIGTALRAGAGIAARGAARFLGTWGGRLAAASVLSGVAGKAAGVAFKVGSFAATYAAVRAMLQSFIYPLFDDAVSRFPASMEPMKYVFQLMVATQHLVPWDDLSLIFQIYLEFMILVLSWRLAMLAWGLSSKVLSEIGDA